MARKKTEVFKTTNRKIKISKHSKEVKLKVGKETPEISTLKTFGININNKELAIKVLEKIYNDAKFNGELISIVAKKYRQKIKNKK
jgi:hypothetical protein